MSPDVAGTVNVRSDREPGDRRWGLHRYDAITGARLEEVEPHSPVVADDVGVRREQT